MRRLILVLAVLSGLLVVSGKSVSAAEVCDSGEDIARFPFGFICPRDGANFNDVPLFSSVPISSTDDDGTSHINLAYGSPGTINFTTGYISNSNSQTRHDPTVTISGGHRNVLLWTTIDANANQLYPDASGQKLQAINNGGISDICPGWGGQSYAPVYNYQDFAGDWNSSPYNYVDKNGKDYRKEDCQTQGSMVYWNVGDAGPSQNRGNSYGFTINVNTTVVDNFCVRTNLSIGDVGSDNIQSPFPPAMSNYQGQVGPPASLQLYNSVAAHVAKKSKQICIEVGPKTGCGGGGCFPRGLCYTYHFNGDNGDYNGMGAYTTIYINGMNRATGYDAAIGDCYGVYAPTGAHDYEYTPGGSGGNTVTIDVRRMAYNAATGQWFEVYHTTATYQCFTATCSISVVGDGPNGTSITDGVVAGGKVHPTVTLTNTSPGPAYPGNDPPQSLNEDWFGAHLGIRQTAGGGGDYGAGTSLAQAGQPGDSVNIHTDFTDGTTDGQPRTYTITYGALYNGPGGFWIGPACSKTISVYQEFQLEPGAKSEMDNEENPTNVAYETWVTNNAPFDLTVPTSNDFYKYTGLTNSTQSLATNPNGTYPAGPNKKTDNLGPASYQVQPNTFQAGDRYCSKIHLDFDHGWKGPGASNENIIATSSNRGVINPCPVVTNKPFFKVYGNSISAGGDFKQPDGSGSCTGSGELAGWFSNIYPTYNYGSSSQLGALAIAQTVGVASAQTVLTRAASELSFANTIGVGARDSDSPLLGGKFGSASHPMCIAAVSPPQNTSHILNPSASIGSGAGQIHDGKYSKDTNLTIDGGTLGAGDSLEIYVDGDVFINDDIKYADSGWTPDDVPQLTIRASGNIYLSNNVNVLDGTYIATPRAGDTTASPKGSTIYTCGTASGSTFTPVSQAAMYRDCNNQLTVHGSLVARHINLMRTYGSLRDEQPVVGYVSHPNVACPSPVPPGYSQTLHGICFSPTGPIPSWNCVNIFEYSDPAWPTGQHYLCSDPAKGMTTPDYAIAPWRDNPTWRTDHGPGTPKPYCVRITQPFNDWSDNELCSNVELVFSNSGSPGRGYDCVGIYDSDSPRGAGWRNSYLCERLDTELQLPDPTAIKCSNSVDLGSNGKQSFNRDGRKTCAAEVFDFSPEVYLKNKQIGAPTPQTYDMATGLPPVL